MKKLLNPSSLSSDFRFLSSRGGNSQLPSSRDGDSHRGDPEIATLAM